jgi:hypothetical protein
MDGKKPGPPWIDGALFIENLNKMPAEVQLEEFESTVNALYPGM